MKINNKKLNKLIKIRNYINYERNFVILLIIYCKVV